jgi:WD40 repeat protein
MLVFKNSARRGFLALDPRGNCSWPKRRKKLDHTYLIHEVILIMLMVSFFSGSVNQYISVYNMEGSVLNTIKYHEGFMGPRIGPVSCLAFHPHRVCLAAGSMDSSISVYSIDPKR